METLERSFFLRDVVEVARDLLGLTLLNGRAGGIIVETEAYHPDEPASHAFIGPTRRNRSLFLEGGHVYVYRIHQVVCANLSVGPAGVGAGVLLRAIVPTDGLRAIAARRRGAPRARWADGPGKLCRALGITLTDDGRDSLAPGAPLRVVRRGPPPAGEVLVGPRVGISRARELPWRFQLRLGRSAEVQRRVS